ncbi:MAG: hypothetical protein K0S61_4725 [Anaerocolumna sp.]|jgi:hypothetical protein|nr:hypothetical protein [Anaerocolumna sp.]
MCNFIGLKETIDKFAPNSEPVLTDKGKMIYTNGILYKRKLF